MSGKNDKMSIIPPYTMNLTAFINLNICYLNEFYSKTKLNSKHIWYSQTNGISIRFKIQKIRVNMIDIGKNKTLVIKLLALTSFSE